MSTSEIMNIRDWIKYCCARGTLFPVEPLIQSDSIERGLYVSGDIYKMLQPPWESMKQEEEWGYARNIMDTFVSGGIVSIPKEGRRKNAPYHQMALLSPQEKGVWDIRATKPKPGIRVVGQFAEKDLFIALVWQHRTVLGGYNSKEWKNVILGCQTKWRNIFPSYAPYTGGDYNDYLSNIILT